VSGPDVTAAGMLDRARAAQAQRQWAVVDALCGRQPRDPQGRWARPAAGFDGGARQTVPPPPESHEQTLSRVLRTGEANVGGHF
jgi:hypothetical protein